MDMGDWMTFATSLAFCTFPHCTKGLLCDLGHLGKEGKEESLMGFTPVC